MSFAGEDEVWAPRRGRPPTRDTMEGVRAVGARAFARRFAAR